MSEVTQAIPTLLKRLRQKMPTATYELNWEKPLDLLVATILAAQCTDERVNRVTETLFQKYKTAQDYAEAPLEELEEDVKPTGFYRNKAKAVQGMCQGLIDNFNGEVPQNIEDLITLPGVARKTANVVLNCAFNIPSGIIVDSHVDRVSRRMGLSQQTKPDKVEQDLMKLVPKDEWTYFGPAMVLHGRYTCTAKSPKCGECMFNDLCEKNDVEE